MGNDLVPKRNLHFEWRIRAPMMIVLDDVRIVAFLLI